MAHLEVEPKPSRPSWVWVLLILLAILLAGMLLKQCYTGNTGTGADTTTVDSTATPL